MNDDDGFEDHEDFEDLKVLCTKPIVPIVQKTKRSKIKKHFHRIGFKTRLVAFLDIFKKLNVSTSKTKSCILLIILKSFGKRNLEKKAVSIKDANEFELDAYNYIRTKLQDTTRRERIFNFIQSEHITKRLINFFIVHYISGLKKVSYYLDKRKYPYTIIGKINEENQLNILQLIEDGEFIVWIDLHLEYKTSKNKNGKSNLHAPYSRSISIRGDDNIEYSLCTLNFYCWLDDVGGFDAFLFFETDVREKKKIYDELHRSKQNVKKRKFGFQQENYKTFISEGVISQPYDEIHLVK